MHAKNRDEMQILLANNLDIGGNQSYFIEVESKDAYVPTELGGIAYEEWTEIELQAELDEEGNPIMIPKLDSEGNEVTQEVLNEETGEITIETVMIEQMIEVEVTKNNNEERPKFIDKFPVKETMDKDFIALCKNMSHKLANGSIKYNNNYQFITASEAQPYLEVLGGELIHYSELVERERVFNLTLEEYKNELIEALKKEKDDVAFEIEFDSSARGEELHYKMNLKTFSELKEMVKTAEEKSLPYILWHDDSMMMHEMENPYTTLEGGKVLLDASLVVAYRDAKYDVFKMRASLMTEKLPKNVVMTEVFSEQEQTYIDAVVNATLASFQ